MIRIFTDFQAGDSDGALFILKIDHDDLATRAQSLGIKVGDKVILDAEEGFEVIGTLEFKFVDVLRREAWVAYADWSTRRDTSATSSA